MVYDVAEILKDYLASVEWIETLGGLVSPQKRKDDKVFPAYLDAGTYSDMTPNSKRMSVCYIEERGDSSVEETTSRRTRMIVPVRVVCWYNLKLINPDTLVPTMMYEVQNAIPSTFKNKRNIVAASVTKSGEGINGDVFSNYNYDEQKQFLMYPYGAFYIDYDVNAWVAKSCVSAVTLNPGLC